MKIKKSSSSVAIVIVVMSRDFGWLLSMLSVLYVLVNLKAVLVVAVLCCCFLAVFVG
jgi:hypothetical protein